MSHICDNCPLRVKPRSYLNVHSYNTCSITHIMCTATILPASYVSVNSYNTCSIIHNMHSYKSCNLEIIWIAFNTRTLWSPAIDRRAPDTHAVQPEIVHMLVRAWNTYFCKWIVLCFYQGSVFISQLRNTTQPTAQCSPWFKCPEAWIKHCHLQWVHCYTISAQVYWGDWVHV